MDSNQLFWATGINNGGLRTDAQQAEEIFRKLSVNVNKHLDSIIQKYKELQNNAKVKFENPVDQQMISSIKSQIGELSKVIDAEINKLGKFTATYDQSMQKIKTATAKISSGGRGGGKSSPLTPMVEGIKEDVGKADKELSFLARRFQYMWGSMLAYGSINMLKNLGSDIIRVKQQFEYAQVAIDSFVGSAEGGKKVFQDLMAFAVKSPMQMEDVTEAAKQWLAYGGSVDTVIDSVRMLSDISAGSGQNIKDLAYLYGTSMTQGRLYQRDLFQFANRGIPVYDALAKTMGKSKEQILALTSAGQVGFPELQKAIESLTAAGGQYYGLSEKMAEKTSGQISNLKDKWTMALKDIGDSQDGLINNSVQGITYLISNWEALAKAITATVAVLGTYQVAKSMVSWEINAKATAANIAEAQSLEALVSAEAKANIAKQSLVVGSAEYAAAIKAEVVLMSQKAAATEAAAVADFNAANIAMESAIQQSVAAQANLASKRQLIAASTGEVTAAELVAAKTAVQTTQLNANTAARELKIASSKLGIATSNKEAIASGISTAALAGEKVGTDLVAAAKIRLTAVTRTLYVTMAAHPYAAAIVGITALVAIIWALHDSTTEAEKAQKRLAESIKGVQTAADDKIKGFNDRLNIIKSETAATADQEKAYRELQMAYKDIIGDMTLKDLKTKESTVLQKANADAVAESRVAELKSLADATKARISIMQANLDDYVSKPGASRAIKLSISSKIKKDKQLLKDQTALYEQAQADLDKSKEDSEDKTLTIKEQIDLATDSVKKYKAELADLRSGKTPSADYAKDIEGKVKELKEAEDRLDILLNKPKDTAGGGGRVDKTQERLDAIIRDSEKIKDMQSKADIDLADAHVSELDNGYIKEKEQAEIEHERKKLDIKKKSEELLKLQNQIDANEFLAKNPNGVVPADATELNAKNQAIINTATEAEDVRYAAFTKKLLNDKLIEYGDYAAERLAIEKKYNDDIKALELERNATNTDSIDSAIRQANVEKSKALMAHSFKKLKESPEFAMAFDDLGNVSTETLEKLMAELNKYQQTAAGAMRLSDFKEYASVIENITDQLIERNPFKVLKENADELAVAERQLQQAKDVLSIVEMGGKLDMTGRIIPEGAKTKAMNYADALAFVAKAQDNVTNKQNKGRKALTEITKEYAELFDKMSGVGDSIGGQAGEIISAISDIGSFVTSAIDGVTAVSATGSAALSTVEKASVILGIISAAIQIATKIASLFTDASKKRREEAEKERQSILDVKQAYLEAYAAMTNKKFENIFGDDVWRKMQAQRELLKKSLLNFRDAYNTAIKGNDGRAYRFSDIFGDGKGRGAVHLYGKEWSQAIFDHFDLVAAKARLAGDRLSDSEKAILQSLINSYESYQEYLDNITSYLSSVFGEIGNELMDNLSENYNDMTGWADDVTGYISDSFAQMMKDIAYSMFFADILDDAQKQIKAAMTDANADDKGQIQSILEVVNKSLIGAGADAAEFIKNTNDAWNKATGQDLFGGEDGGDRNSTRSAIQSMSQESADILTAQFSAMRINIDKIRVEMGGIGGNMTVMNINVKDILLSLQTQAASLQMVFSDISRIAKNTDRLEAIENSLNKVLTNGVKAL